MIWLLDIPGSCVEKDSPIAPDIIAQNELYRQLLNKKKVQNESFSERGVQTLNLPLKSKEVSIAPPKSKEAGSSATEWDIVDTFKQVSDQAKVLQNIELKNNEHFDTILMEELDKEPGSWLDYEGSITDTQEKEKKKDLSILTVRSVHSCLTAW